jgi:ribosomal protein L37AE/L43A
MSKCWSCGRNITGDSQTNEGLWTCDGCGWVSSYTDESPIQSLDILKVERELNK